MKFKSLINIQIDKYNEASIVKQDESGKVIDYLYGSVKVSDTFQMLKLKKELKKLRAEYVQEKKITVFDNLSIALS